jgi:hypothetical protein
LDDIDELLADARSGIEAIGMMHAESVDAGALVIGMRPRIKSVLEHQRSVLDYLVRQVNAKHCPRPPQKPFYPMAREAKNFTAAFDSNMPRVRKHHPNVAHAFCAHQPFVPGQEWVGWLSVLVNANKHNELTPQTQEDYEEWRSAQGGSISGIAFEREGQAPTSDPTGFLGPGPWTRETITEWAFTTPKIAIGIALHKIQAGVEETVKDVRHAAGL